MKPKIFTLRPFTGSVCRPLPYKNAVTVGGWGSGREQKVSDDTCWLNQRETNNAIEEVKLPRHRARKAEKCRKWMGAGSSWRLPKLLTAPIINWENASLYPVQNLQGVLGRHLVPW